MPRPFWWRAAAAMTAIVLGGAFAAVPAQAEPTTPTYTNADVGFEESIYQKVDPGPRLDREWEYAGGRNPFIRVDLEWTWLEQTSCPGPCADGLDWSGIDKTVDAAHQRGFRVMLILDYTPKWANGGHESGKFFPTRDHDGDWADVVQAAVEHFGTKVQAYEVWNEPNLQGFGDFDVPGTDAQRVPERKKRYWELVKLAYPRIKQGCPSCVVVAGGSAQGTPNGYASSSAAWLQAGYDEHARDYFDAVAHHPYFPNQAGPDARMCESPWDNPFGPIYRNDKGQLCGELAAVRDVLVRNGDAGKKIWGTEWGVPTKEPYRPNDSLARVRNIQVDAVHLWRSVDWTGPLFLFTYQDSPRSEDCVKSPNLGDCNFGVETNEVDGSHHPKSPLFEDMRTALQGGWPDRLYWNQAVFENSALRSPDGRFFLWMQGDGNLVLYRTVTATTPAQVLWSVTNKHGSLLINQADGSLALKNRQGVSAWNSGSYQGPDRTATLILQNDGNLVLYRDSDRKAIWASNTCCR
ncbi:hypothetical protein [Krasilnikovia sp. MM14-A1259]|uniref:hypothetical protein n=1 Tax=Krasilnikovia sp. MM14-A1259 TaxID=3373539 RepID=UPI0037F34A69